MLSPAVAAEGVMIDVVHGVAEVAEDDAIATRGGRQGREDGSVRTCGAADTADNLRRITYPLKGAAATQERSCRQDAL